MNGQWLPISLLLSSANYGGRGRRKGLNTRPVVIIKTFPYLFLIYTFGPPKLPLARRFHVIIIVSFDELYFIAYVRTSQKYQYPRFPAAPPAQLPNTYPRTSGRELIITSIRGGMVTWYLYMRQKRKRKNFMVRLKRKRPLEMSVATNNNNTTRHKKRVYV